MTIPAMFQHANISSKKKINIHDNGENEIWTPTKRKLILNNNIRTLLRIYQHTPYILGAQVASLAKKRRCDETD